MINAGDLRHRVTLMRDPGPVTGNPVGQYKPTYAAVGTYYALVECVGGSKDANGNQLRGSLNYRVTFRANVGPIRPSDQLAWTNQGVAHTLNIVSSTVDPFNVFAIVDCTEKVPMQ